VSAKRRQFTPSKEIRKVKRERYQTSKYRSHHYPIPINSDSLHHASNNGVIIFVGVAILLYLLSLSLESEAGFVKAQQLVGSPIGKFVLWGIVSGLLYHLVAGTKHLIMDWGIGETLAGAAIGSRITLILSTLLIVIAGVWIW
jgi:succinate dehydrogenase / fumarate reductase cytochrome b subunit